MGVDAVVVLCVLAVLVYFFLTDKAPVDQTALAGLMLLVLLGYIPYENAFAGFSSTAVITMIGTFFLGAALRITGVAEKTAALVNNVVGKRELLNVFAVMLLGAMLSAVMSNVAATALLLPAVVSIAHRAELSPSRLLIPLAFSTVLGGMTTLIGTMPNILIADIMEEQKLEPFSFFAFTPFGVALVLVGILYVSLYGHRQLPERESSRKRKGKRDLKSVYRLRERMFSLSVPKGSAVAGKTLSEIQFGKALDAHVLTVLRGEERILAPSGDEVLREGDVLLVRGNIKELRRLLRFRGAKVKAVEGEFVQSLAPRYQARSFVVNDSDWEDLRVKDLRLRPRFGVVVAAVERKESFLSDGLAEESLQLGDRIHVLGTEDELATLEAEVKISLSDSPIGVPEFFESHAFTVQVSEESPLVGTPLKESRIVGMLDLNLFGLKRPGTEGLQSAVETEIGVGDVLLFVGERDFMRWLIQLGELKVESTEVDSEIESKEIGVVEAVLSPRSKLIDKSLRDIRFGDRYGFHCLAIWREGKPVRSRVAKAALRFGDALLLQGPRKKMSLLAQDSDFVVLSQDLVPPKREAKAPIALMGLLITIVLAAFQIFPAHIATFAGATFAALFGAVKMREAYREVEWRVIFLVACLIPIGRAVGDVGLASLAANTMVDSVGGLGPLPVFIAFSLFSSLLSQTLDGTLTVVLLAPISIETAAAMGVSPTPFLMGVAMAASIAFLTPFSHKANLLVMGAGGYRAKDYFRIGLPITILSFLTLWLVVPLLLPFR